MLLLASAVAGIVSAGVAAVAWVLTHREGAGPATTWGSAGKAFAVVMSLLMTLSGVVVVVLRSQ